MQLGMWMTSCPEAMGWGFWVIFEKKQLVEIWSWTKRVDFLDLGEASPVGSTRCVVRCWDRWNSQHSKNYVSLSSCWKPKSQEGNRSFVPELPRVVSVSSVLRIPMHTNILYICIVVLWLCNIYIKYIIKKHILEITFLNKPEHILCTQLNSFKYF